MAYHRQVGTCPACDAENVKLSRCKYVEEKVCESCAKIASKAAAKSTQPEPGKAPKVALPIAKPKKPKAVACASVHTDPAPTYNPGRAVVLRVTCHSMDAIAAVIEAANLGAVVEVAKC